MVCVDGPDPSKGAARHLVVDRGAVRGVDGQDRAGAILNIDDDAVAVAAHLRVFREQV